MKKSHHGFGTPQMGPITTGLGEIYQYTKLNPDLRPIFSNGFKDYSDWVVKRQLSE
jgi:cobalt-zinc-cadmium resistance protein CzcA